MPANDTPTINEQWHEFAKLVLPADATDAQRREMKRAFFGGFAAGFTAALDLPANCPNYFDRHARSERYFDEMRGFQVAIEEGGA